MFAIFIVTAALGIRTAVNTAVVKPVVYVAKKTQECPVVQGTEHAVVYAAEKVVKVVTFGSYGK